MNADKTREWVDDTIHLFLAYDVEIVDDH